MTETTVHTRYSTSVDTLNQAWQFVMNHVDKFEAPQIEINPVWVFTPGEEEEDKQQFEVSVSGDSEFDE